MSGLLLALILLAGLVVAGIGAWRCYLLLKMLRPPRPAPPPRWYTGVPTFAPGQVTFTPPPRPDVKSAPSQVPAPSQSAPLEETQKLRAAKKEPPPPPRTGWSPGRPYKDLFPPPDVDEAKELEADTALLLAMPTPRHALPKKLPITSILVSDEPAAETPAGNQPADAPAEAAASGHNKPDDPPPAPDTRPDSVPM